MKMFKKMFGNSPTTTTDSIVSVEKQIEQMAEVNVSTFRGLPFDELMKFIINNDDLVTHIIATAKSGQIDGASQEILAKDYEIACNGSGQAVREVASPKRGAVYDAVAKESNMMERRKTLATKSSETLEILVRGISTNVLFQFYSNQERRMIAETFEAFNVVAGESVIRQGEQGDHFYVVELGTLELYLEREQGARIKVGASLGPGSTFGELALLYNIPRTATIIAVDDCRLWRVDRQTYRYIVSHANQLSLSENLEFIRNITMFQKRLGDVLNDDELNLLVTGSEIEEFSPGDVIVRQGQPGDCFYIIKSGDVSVRRVTVADSDTGYSLGLEVNVLTSGGYFGEKAILEEDVRQASCVAVGFVSCLSISREMFIRLVGSWDDITGKQTSTLSDVVEGISDPDAQNSTGADQGIVLTDLELMVTLGQGAFGKVRLARHKVTNQVMVLKIQSKKMIQEFGMETVVENEIKLMRELDHPFIARLYSAMQDSKAIYLVIELLQGGDFFSLMKKFNKLSEDRARFYSAIVVTALEAMHLAKIAYRDLKPENMVVDSQGYIKLIDLGLAKRVTTGKTWTLCGTPDYIAPEIVLNKGHDHAVDYWALGVLMYEMVDGWPTFYNKNAMKVYENIISGVIKFPSNFSANFINLIQSLLQKNPARRLGNAKGGAGEIRKHKWFGSFDWRALLKGQVASPYVPPIKDPFDTSNFDLCDEEDTLATEADSAWEADLK